MDHIEDEDNKKPYKVSEAICSFRILKCFHSIIPARLRKKSRSVCCDFSNAPRQQKNNLIIRSVWLGPKINFATNQIYFCHGQHKSLPEAQEAHPE
jgi:hypothetical protein